VRIIFDDLALPDMMLDADADKQAKNGARKTALEYATKFFTKVTILKIS